MKILVSGFMGPGTLEAAIEPLTRMENVKDIRFIRKEIGPAFSKIQYITLPTLAKIPLFHGVIAPIFIIREIFRQKTDLLIGFHILPYALFACFSGRVTRTPYIVTQTGLSIQRQSKNPLLKCILGTVFSHVLQVNCPGNMSVVHWQSTFPTMKEKFKAMHSTVDVIKFIPSIITKNEFDFLFLGRLASIKNIDLIIKAFHQLLNSYPENSGLKMAIVGSGPERVKLEKLVGLLNLKDSIIFIGFVEVPVRWFQKSRFLVMASTTEGLPTAMMQAMACEVIPITNLVGNISDIVCDNETGFVFSSLTKSSIAESMQRALLTPETQLSEMRSRCREIIVKEHSHDYAISRWEEIFKRITLKTENSNR